MATNRGICLQHPQFWDPYFAAGHLLRMFLHQLRFVSHDVEVQVRSSPNFKAPTIPSPKLRRKEKISSHFQIDMGVNQNQNLLLNLGYLGPKGFDSERCARTSRLRGRCPARSNQSSSPGHHRPGPVGQCPPRPPSSWVQKCWIYPKKMLDLPPVMIFMDMYDKLNEENKEKPLAMG